VRHHPWPPLDSSDHYWRQQGPESTGVKLGKVLPLLCTSQQRIGSPWRLSIVQNHIFL